MLSFGYSLYCMTVDGEIINSVQNFGQSQVRVNTSKPLSHPHRFQLPLKLLFSCLTNLHLNTSHEKLLLTYYFILLISPSLAPSFFLTSANHSLFQRQIATMWNDKS